MTTMVVRQQVSDFDSWKLGFDEHEKVRRSHGATGHRVLRDGNDVLVLIDFPDAAGAREFQTDPSLKEAMARAGVVGAPDISLRSDGGQEQY